MQINKINFISLGIILLISVVGAHEKKWPEKRLRQVYPEAQSFTSKQVALSSSQISELKSEGVQIGSEDRNPTFYFAQEKENQTDMRPKTLGVILFVAEVGPNGTMEISVAMGVDGRVKKIDIWEHSENSLVAKEDFLKQFIGKKSKDSFVKSKDYKPVTEAEKPSEAIAMAVKKSLKISNLVFEKK